MKNKLMYSALVVGFLSLFCMFSFATYDDYTEVSNPSICINDLSATVNGQTIKTENAKGQETLFLPSSANLNSLILNIDTNANHVVVWNGDYGTDIYGAKSVNVKNIATFDKESGSYSLALRAFVTDEESRTLEYSDYSFKICKSENIGSMYISFKDSAYGREWIDQTKINDAGKFTTVKMFMENSAGETIYDGKLTSIKGRGNSSSLRPKKPYQIKLDKKTDLLQSGNDSNKAKTWILIANAIDKTMIKNPFAFDLGKYFGLTETPEYTFADVYFDGIYRGTYLVCEKVQINSGRVEINDLEDVITTTDETATAQGKNKYGMEYQYNPTSSVPEGTDISGGYLLEQDPAFYRSENSWFKTIDGLYIVLKNPEFATKEMVEYVSERFYEMASAAKSGSFNKKYVEEYIDIDSLAACYLVNEYMFNVDYQASSTYFFLPEENNTKYEKKFYAGPLWDFDTSLGNRSETPNNFAQDPNYVHLLNRLYYKTKIVRKTIMNKAIELESFYDVIYSPTPVSRYGIKSWSSYKQELLPAITMNYNLWVFDNTENTFSLPTYEENYNYALNFMNTRHQALMPQLTKLEKESSSSFIDAILNFIQKIINWFKNLFN